MVNFLYGLDHASHDFTQPESLGKNIFTNALPLALCQYIALERQEQIPVITAVERNGALSTEHVFTDWKDIILTDPTDAYFGFESVFEGFSAYTHTSANKSDVVISNRKTKKQCSPLEIKLVVTPTSSTANSDYDKQSCEIVVRPPTIEQLAFSIAHSYGTARRVELMDSIVKALGKPNDYKWSDEQFMLRQLPNVLKAAENVVRGGIDNQTPLVLTAVWRTEGQKPILQENAFDAFVWTDMAFLQLFIDQARNSLYRSNGKPKEKLPSSISRPNRSLIWMINALFDYTVQTSLNFPKVHSAITYGVQTDKAGAFAGERTLRHLKSKEFLEPRVLRRELSGFLSPQSADYLLPERRLDAAIAIQHLAEQMVQDSD